MEFLGEVLWAIFIQLLMTVGVIFLFGFIISRCNKLFYSALGRKSRAICIITGCIGTPIHEAGHALMCLIFGHRIIKMKLFSLDTADGTLGYVTHSYNSRSIYQKIGNFFIGIAPIIFGTAVMLLLLLLLCGDTFYNVWDFIMGGGTYGHKALGVLTSFFNVDNLVSPLWWIFIVVSCFVALHMNLSKADIRGSLSGLVFVVIITVAINLVLGIVGLNTLEYYSNTVIAIGVYMTVFLCLSLIFSLILCLIAAIVALVSKGSRRRRYR